MGVSEQGDMQKKWFPKDGVGRVGMDYADRQNRSEWRGRLRGRLAKQVQSSVEENGALKWI